MSWRRALVILVALLFLFLLGAQADVADPARPNGFDLSNTVVGTALNRNDTNKKAADFFAEELISLILEGF